jgi:hypothetical protein
MPLALLCSQDFRFAILTSIDCTSVGWDANRVLHAPLLQRFTDLRLGEGGVGAKDHLFAQLLLPLDLGKQQFLPVAGTVDVAGPRLCRQTVALAVEPQQRVIAGGLEVSVVGALLLLAVDRDLGRVHVQKHPEPMSRELGSWLSRSASFTFS